MIAWVRENAGLASFLASVVFVIASVAVSYHQLSSLIASQPAVEAHIHDSTRHIDPVRDAEDRKRLIERIEKLEQKLEWAQRRRGREWRRRDEK